MLFVKATNKKIVKIFSIIILLIFIILSIYLSIPLIKHLKEPLKFKDWINSFGIYSTLVYILIVIISIIITIIPGEPLELVSGYAFGLFKGTIFCILAESIGSIIVVLLVRKYGIKFIELFFDKDKIDSIKFLQESKKKTIIFSILFIIPGTPKDLLCYYAGLSTFDLTTALLITTIGRLPSIITSILIGSSLSNQDYKLSIVIFIITALISLAGILIYNNHKNKK